MNEFLNLQNSVVRIIAQNIETNWLQPYKNDDSNSGIGSGFFIDKSGYILTCSHLVIDTKKIFIEVPYKGKEKFEAELLYVCPNFDIALLKTLNFKPKSFLKLYNSQQLYKIKSGEEVYAIGFPLGQNNLKISKGVISGRQNGLIQTTAPINPGNSGGPLLYKNKVVGINISKITFASNVGYAAPISHYHVIDNYRNKKQKIVLRPVFGFEFVYTNKAFFISKKLPSDKTGVLISFVYKNSPAWNCGLRAGDILCKINKLNVDNNGLLDRRWFNEKMSIDDTFDTFKIGDSIKIEYISNLKTKNCLLKVVEFQPKIKRIYPLYDKSVANKYEVFGGMVVAELNLFNIMNLLKESKSLYVTKKIAMMAKWLLSSNKEDNVCIVTHIFSNSIIKNEEIVKEGDIIEKVNGKDVKTIDDYRKLIGESKKYINYKFSGNKEYVLDLISALENEKEFSELFKYPLSNTYQKLTKKKLNTNQKKLNKSKKNKSFSKKNKNK